MRGTCFGAALAAAAVVLAVAGNGPLDRATLKGVKAVNVVIDPLSEDLLDDGLSIAALRGRLEMTVQQAGIPLERTSTDFLGLRIISARSRRSPVALSFSLGLYQPVVLSRDQNTRTVTATWGADSVVLSPARDVPEAALDTVDQLAQQFIGAYRSANPN